MTPPSGLFLQTPGWVSLFMCVFFFSNWLLAFVYHQRIDSKSSKRQLPDTHLTHGLSSLMSGLVAATLGLFGAAIMCAYVFLNNKILFSFFPPFPRNTRWCGKDKNHEPAHRKWKVSKGEIKWERERERVRERESVCVCERESVCVCVRERARERVCVCVTCLAACADRWVRVSEWVYILCNLSSRPVTSETRVVM